MEFSPCSGGGGGSAACTWKIDTIKQTNIINEWFLTILTPLLIAIMPSASKWTSIRPCIELIYKVLVLTLDLGVIEVHTPIKCTGTTIDNALAVNIGEHVGITGKQGLGRAHFRT